MKKKIAIINGVNLSELGSREVNIYGNETFESYFQELEGIFPNLQLSYFQANSIDLLVELLLQCKHCDGIILNPAAYTHCSVVLADTIRTISAPVLEVHISNVFARESFRKRSLVAPACVGSISGLGLRGYEAALHYFNR